jgi:hypothetical protein
MRTVCISSLDELAPYADAWERLTDGVPFRSWTWLCHWWRHYGPRNSHEARQVRLAVLCVFDDSETLVGVAPWYVESSSLQGRVLRPLGSGKVCSEYLSVLCDRAQEEPVVEALAEHLVCSAFDNSPGALHWDMLDWDSVDGEDCVVARLMEHLEKAGCTVDRRPGPCCWRLDLPTTWESYVASMGKSQRRTVRRLEREMSEADDLVLHSTLQPGELPRAMDILVDLHQRRRKMLGDEGCFASERFLGFYRDVVPELFRQGRVQIHWLELGGKPIAAEYQLLGNGVIYVYQAGVDPDAMEHEPGNMINVAILRRAIEQGFRAYDFLRGDEQYKSRFRAQPRPSVDYRVAPRRVVPQVRLGLWRAKKGVKQWMKKMHSSFPLEP